MLELSLTNEQKIIIESDARNIIISACAGSGKSSTLAIKALEEVRLNNSWKFLSILTFTNKSKQDLEKRLSDKNILINTFHGFIYKNIFPFDSSFLGDFSENFKIRATTYKEWFNFFSEQKVIVGSAGSNDFVIQHALEIMSRSNLLSYLKSRFQAIYIDEAQDNNIAQYEFVEKFISIGVKVLMVGDPNQTLYQFRGASPTKFRDYCADPRFKSLSLSRNFRCHYIIDKIANSYSFPNQNNLDENGCGYYLINGSKIGEIVSNYNSESIAFLRKANAELSDCDNKFSILKDLAFNSDVFETVRAIVICILRIKFQSGYYFYNLFDDLRIDANFYSNKDQQEIKLSIDNFISELDIDELKKFLSFLSFSDFYEEVYENYIKLVGDTITRNFFSDLSKHVTMTIHSSKGLEFDNVIISKYDFFYKNQLENNNFYVAFTRARKRIFVIS
ncbi:ATP-dependent helicase [uncultured Acinetobacter sp.]|uniref:ATP-dependent helicase n=1 Tax=uncultured Acinetobacter sp. TaxID=165433 RepID=UPI0025F36432|nr:ATP-dependent helicase [uncultured Acinetobacter sp.]